MRATDLPAAPEPPVRRFERVAAQQPDAIALEHGGQTLTYGALDRRSDLLAAHLVEQGVERGTPVAVRLPPSLDLLTSMLATWKAGGIYAPLDPGSPDAHLEPILEELRPRALVTLKTIDLTAPLPGLSRCFLDEPLPRHIHQEPAKHRSSISLDQPATIFHTSGSTGKPKGVVASHTNLDFFTRAARERYGFSPGDTFCTIARNTFSISLFEQVSPLLCGGRLLLLPRAQVLDPERLASVLTRVTVLHAGPSLLRLFFRYLEKLPVERQRFLGVRHASTGGDRVPHDLLEKMTSVFPRAELFVIYGCTEICCMGSTHPLPRGNISSRPLVGKPFPGVTLRLLQDDGSEAPQGTIGSIFAASPGLALGYLNRPEIEAARFLEINGERFYATGDLGRIDAAGDLEMLGREDDQIKLHGARIEPFEIEQALRQAPGVRDAAVIAFEPEGQEKVLVAFVVGELGHDAPRTLRPFLKERFSDCMIPAEYIVLPALPLNANLKVDRKALPALAREHLKPPSLATIPDTSVELEALITALFARYLGCPRVEASADFFELGGSSLLALRVTDELNRQFALQLPLHTLFQHPSASAVATLIQSGSSPELRPVPLNRCKRQPRLFLLAAVQAYRYLARELETTCGVSALSVEPPSPPGHPLHLDELAASYVDQLCEAQPDGAYFLAGYSFGGVIAFEVAQQLRKRGREIAHLWLLDSILPMHQGDWLRRARRFASLTIQQQSRLIKQEWVSFSQRTTAKNEDPQEDLVQLREEQKARDYLGAVKSYLKTIRPYEGPTTLVIAGKRIEENPLRDPFNGWDRYTPNPKVVTVNAHHETLLTGPSAREIADNLRAELR